MKLALFSPLAERQRTPRVAAILAGGRLVGIDAVVQVAGRDVPGLAEVDVTSIITILATSGVEPLRKALGVFVEQGGAEQASTIPVAECYFQAPLRPGKVVTVARNYREHLAESGVTEIGPVPSASIKASSSICGPYDDILRPAIEKQLDYETELAVVIGRRCKNVSEADAFSVIAGYVVMNDVIARQILKIERKAGNQFLGRMFDHFGPLGPYLVTADEISDPMGLKIQTRVNGEIRQSGNTRDMIWSIPQLIAYFSQATLEPGDIVSTGTPAGVAAGRHADEAPWFLNPGDIVESEVENIGILSNRVVDDGARSSWAWNR
jgi:2-keto-4-pentenoate hydratase/2-oxohepta-3-ene-1,7-dioic acid hydratase in catechol pathway